MWCDGCTAPRDVLLKPQSVQRVVRVEEDRKPILWSERASQGFDFPLGIRTLVTWCTKNQYSYDTAHGMCGGVWSAVFVAPSAYGNVFVAYECRGFACKIQVSRSGEWTVRVRDEWKFSKALCSTLPGKGSLRDAKRALGMEVPELKPRTAKPRTSTVKRATKTDTMR